MTCALGQWQHSTAKELHQVLREDGSVFDTYRNRGLANRVAAQHGYRVETVDPQAVINNFKDSSNVLRRSLSR